MIDHVMVDIVSGVPQIAAGVLMLYSVFGYMRIDRTKLPRTDLFSARWDLPVYLLTWLGGAVLVFLMPWALFMHYGIPVVTLITSFSISYMCLRMIKSMVTGKTPGRRWVNFMCTIIGYCGGSIAMGLSLGALRYIFSGNIYPHPNLMVFLVWIPFIAGSALQAMGLLIRTLIATMQGGHA